MSELAITVAEWEGGSQSAQFWDLAHKHAGVVGPVCLAQVSGPPRSANDLVIVRGCPREWAEIAIDAYLTGAPVAATHTVEWHFGLSRFTAIEDGDV